MKKLVKFLMNDSNNVVTLVAVSIMCAVWSLIIVGLCVVVKCMIADGDPGAPGKLITYVAALFMVVLSTGESLALIDMIVREIKNTRV